MLITGQLMRIQSAISRNVSVGEMTRYGNDIVDDDQLTISLEGASCVSRTARPSQLVRTGRIQSVWTWWDHQWGGHCFLWVRGVRRDRHHGGGGDQPSEDDAPCDHPLSHNYLPCLLRWVKTQQILVSLSAVVSSCCYCRTKRRGDPDPPLLPAERWGPHTCSVRVCWLGLGSLDCQSWSHYGSLSEVLDVKCMECD